jgi:hypothetical protein
MERKMKVTGIALMALVVACSQASAQGCDDYPFTQGINVEDVNGGTKIVSTSAVPVSFDDVDSIKDARDEATLEAKSLISAFMSEGIRSEQIVNKAVQETKSMQGDAKVAARNEVTNRIKRLASSSQALLRGVVPLGECYTKGKELRVSVGIKPETIASAENLAGGIANSVANQPNAGGSPSNSTVQRPSGVEGYSNTDALKKF